MLAWDMFKDVAPRPAAALLIVTETPQLRILLAQRNQNLRFMGGHHVFPGGRIQNDDAPPLVDHADDEDEARAIFAAVREAFEETGLLCISGALPPAGQRREARIELIQERRTFRSILEEWGLRIDARDYIPAGIWVTPPFSPVRFHTHYYLYLHEEALYEEVLSDEDEIVGLEWLTPLEARRRWHEGTLRLSAPVAFVLQHLAVLPLPEAVPWLRNTPGHDFGSPTRFELRRGLHLIPLLTPTLPPATHTNCIVIGEETLYVIDPGPPDASEQAALHEHLSSLCAIGGKVAAVLLTHSHPDHIGAADFVRNEFGAAVWAHARTAEQVPFMVDRLLEDGDLIELAGDPGWRLRCLYTPGHDPGHLCFLEESTRTLCCGDMAANPGTIVISPDYEGDMTRYLESLQRLQSEKFSFLIPGHGLPVWGAAGAELLSDLIAHRLEREEKVRAALNDGLTDVRELLERVYDDTPEEAWPIAEHQLRAHLARIRTLG